MQTRSARAHGLHSNEAPMIYLGWFDQNDGGAYELQEDLVRGPAHEFQHLINFVNHALLSNDLSASEDTFINEGLSMLAQDLALPRQYPSLTHDSLDAMRHADLWLASPQSYSLTGFSGIDPGKSARRSTARAATADRSCSSATSTTGWAATRTCTRSSRAPRPGWPTSRRSPASRGRSC